jgi:hypothetical protein
VALDDANAVTRQPWQAGFAVGGLVRGVEGRLGKIAA